MKRFLSAILCFVMLLGMLMLTSEVQDINAPLPIEVTPSGMMMLVNVHEHR